MIVATTTSGTTPADFFDRSLGIGYVGGSSILFAVLLATLGLWYWSLGSVAIDAVTSPKVEIFYWATITVQYSKGWKRRAEIWALTAMTRIVAKIAVPIR